MNGKHKLYFLLIAIESARTITPNGEPLLIDPTNDLNSNYRELELQLLFTKLEKDEKILKVLKKAKEPNTSIFSDTNRGIDHRYYAIILLPAFDDYFMKIQEEPEYQKYTGKKTPTQTKLPPSRKALEKIWAVLQEIEDKRGITSAQDAITIPQVHQSKIKNEREAQEMSDERLNILRKLENEDHAIKDVRWPNDFRQLVYLKIGSNYHEVFEYYAKEYKEAAQAYKQSHQQEQLNIENSVYEIKYSDKTRKILINNFLLKQFRSFGENEAVFAYLYSNPNEDASLQDIKTATGLDTIKDLNKFVENAGFTGDMRKVFFKVSKDSIRFNNPISKKDLQELGIDQLKIPS